LDEKNKTKPNQTHGMVKDECNDTTIVKNSHTSCYYSYCVHGKNDKVAKFGCLDIGWDLHPYKPE
jgi:hypothetical protein